MKKACVIGYGISGKSAAEFLSKIGYEVFAVEEKRLSFFSQEDCKVLAQKGIYLGDKVDPVFLQNCDLVILSPGVPIDHPICIFAQKAQIEVIGEAELAFRFLAQHRPMQKCIGITGTNGKTTVTMLVEHILRKSGKKAKALGNIGTAFTSALFDMDPEEILVAELSSYQLETMKTPVFSTGVILNITPDHLDRYSSMQEYARAKSYLQRCIKEGGVLYIYENCRKEYPDLFTDSTIMTYGDKELSSFYTDKKHLYEKTKAICSLPDVFALKGIHESENALAAWCLVSHFGVTTEEFIQAIETFKKPSHRIEYVRTIDGVDYYDDSKGTNVDAVIVAVKAMKGPVVLIAGGVDKGFPFTIWKESFQDKVKSVISIGEAASKISKEIGDDFTVYPAKSLQEAVQKASSLAKQGDCVLLSPGCASFDMFRDYAHRGQEFKRYVAELENRRIHYEP